MLHPETLFKESAANPDVVELQSCLEDNNLSQIPEDNNLASKRLTHRWGVTMVDDSIIIPESVRWVALNAVDFATAG